MDGACHCRGRAGRGLVNGKLDAVFIGGLDPSSTTARFTVVDWKTGRRPTKPDDITRKLAQLDMYRLLLAAVEGVELDSIDATLYYVSEPDEACASFTPVRKPNRKSLPS